MNPKEKPVFPNVEPSKLAQLFDEELPLRPSAPEKVLESSNAHRTHGPTFGLARARVRRRIFERRKDSFRPVVVRRYPLTLIFENDRTAVPFVGLPIESAGRNVVKISRFFNCGNTAFASSGCDRMR